MFIITSVVLDILS